MTPAVNKKVSSAEEEPTAFRGGEKETEDSGDGDVAAPQEEERSISAPLVLSQEKLEKVSRKLRSLQEHVKRLQVREARGRPGGTKEEEAISSPLLSRVKSGCSQNVLMSNTGNGMCHRRSEMFLSSY